MSNFQDDDREQEMRQLFGLYKDEREGRSGVDAFLDLDGRKISFELKTTSKGSVTTARDFGTAHIEKWKDKHWLIGFYMGDETYYHYVSPAMMAPWIKKKADYIEPDFRLAEVAPSNLHLDDMYKIIGEKSAYTIEDAQRIQKRQYSKAHYIDLQDLESGYTPQRMLQIVRDRARYLMERGSTLNNPHIPFNYFAQLEKITENHAQRLRLMVRRYLESVQ